MNDGSMDHVLSFSQGYDYGAVVTLTPTAGIGSHFGGWTGDGSGNPRSITMSGGQSVTATFTLDEYTLTVNVDGSGSVIRDPERATYHYGDLVQLTANAADGYAFAGWSGDLTSATSPDTIIINGDKAVTAIFEVSMRATLISVSCSPTTVDRNGDHTTEISGALTLADGSGVTGKTVTLWYNSGDGNWVQIETPGMGSTGTGGAYSFSWVVPPSLRNGLYIIGAKFAGDASDGESEHFSSGTGNNLHVVPEYLFGALVAIIACFAAFVVFHKHKSLPHFKIRNGQRL